MISKLLLYFGQLSADEVGLPKVEADNNGLQTVLTLVFGTVTMVTVIFIIITGLKLITQQGDPVGLSKARQGLIYSLVGLVIVLFADVVVYFVIGKL